MEILQNNIQNKLINLEKLYNIIIKLSNNDKKNTLLLSFNKELDYSIDSIEENYYQHILKNIKTDNKLNDFESEIINTRKVFEKFMPYILAYQLANNDNINNN
jgi:hypothetical protein